MPFIADLHIHSKYSRATSKDMDLEGLSKWAKLKGVSLLGTGDFTHPLWLAELKEKLEPLGNGFFSYKDTQFVLTVEVSNIYSQDGALRKIHQLILAPDFKTVDAINSELKKHGNLKADGRPTLGLSAKELARLLFQTSEDIVVIPAHVWTPWFSLFGSNSGFNSLEECYQEFAPRILAVETGLSSDPTMNWRLSALDSRAIVSFSDAHSPAKIGREACVFATDLSYTGLREAIKGRAPDKLLRTIEFFPEEGKYHFSGHRNCSVIQSPSETREKGAMCPVCHKKLTLGVMHRVEELADRPQGFEAQNSPPFKCLIPLEEIIAEALGKQTGTVAVRNEYMRFVSTFGGEFKVLLDTPLDDLKHLDSKIAEGIKIVREGKVKIFPGFDGVYGKVSIFHQTETAGEPAQLDLF